MCIDMQEIISEMSIVHAYMIITSTGATALSRAAFGQGSGQIWLDNVACTGSESRLIDCSANPLGFHNCGHYEDAGVRCSANTCE